jgi:HEAT repeat protein
VKVPEPPSFEAVPADRNSEVRAAIAAYGGDDMRRTPADTDYDAWVRWLAISSFRRQEAKQHLLAAGAPAVPAIRRGLRDDDPVVRRLCVNLLDRLVDDEAIPDLVAVLDDDDVDVVKRALHALACDGCKRGGCRPGDELFVTKAVELLRHPNPDLRAGAIDALGQVVKRGRFDVAAILAEVAEHDPDRGLRGMARMHARQ